MDSRRERQVTRGFYFHASPEVKKAMVAAIAQDASRKSQIRRIAVDHSKQLSTQCNDLGVHQSSPIAVNQAGNSSVITSGSLKADAALPMKFKGASINLDELRKLPAKSLQLDFKAEYASWRG